ncbi:hypothetical protein TDB9533_02020 [Thalassocella blandensis]|nr:hypothetical protein TDB9533_02020 [Thalassocella blandensis]
MHALQSEIHLTVPIKDCEKLLKNGTKKNLSSGKIINVLSMQNLLSAHAK